MNLLVLLVSALNQGATYHPRPTCSGNSLQCFRSYFARAISHVRNHVPFPALRLVSNPTGSAKTFFDLSAGIVGRTDWMGGQANKWLIENSSHVTSADEWNLKAHEIFPGQPALRIHQLDLRDESTNPLLAKFWGALRNSLHADEKGGAQELYRVDKVSEKIYGMQNHDAREMWFLSAEGEELQNTRNTELLSGFQSSELPEVKLQDIGPEWRPQGHDPELRLEGLDRKLTVPAALLRAYKSEILKFILRERSELESIIESARTNDAINVQVLWDHKVLRRSFDGGLATQSKLRFHRDKVPEDLEGNSSVLCVFTVITVLENHDLVTDVHPLLVGDKRPQSNSLNEAGTVFKLDTHFGCRKRFGFDQMRNRDSDRFLYWYSSSIPGRATLFNNFNFYACWNCANNDRVTIEYSFTPQMAHSVAKVKEQRTAALRSQANVKRTRTILQTKVAFCSSSLSQSDAEAAAGEVIDRLQLIGLGPHLAGSVYINYYTEKAINEI
eukprot:gnl/MRDRNA2_/MRDRNA2_59803_c0_seq1.p1 gnl/MRDRNA2_/MRDRNA2_59803_c0~~gnl/MRDRNA2_/MRDRNA2_59803_c0_seq1.p1  ORF type:complete len:499 (+),score=63.32 gnl/MRDRNA2_/MRDRNA2_59803_c0_seq1:87-1583(+)